MFDSGIYASYVISILADHGRWVAAIEYIEPLGKVIQG
jgi:hypothetical protein